MMMTFLLTTLLGLNLASGCQEYCPGSGEPWHLLDTTTRQHHEIHELRSRIDI